MINSRREFLKLSALGGVSTIASPALLHSKSLSSLVNENHFFLKVSFDLLKEWCDALIKFQIKGKDQIGLYGGIMCPSCARIHGRCSDAIYPLMHLASTTGEQKYIESAILLYDWMENNVSLSDGSWINDVNVSDWVGTTVFTSIALAEAILHHRDLLEKTTMDRWMMRLKKAADYIDERFHIDYSNINYPIAGAYALALLGELFEEDRYTSHAKKLAHQSLEYFSENDYLLFGEGEGDKNDRSPKGCLPVDLGYNVEESLPALLLYGLFTNDSEVIEKVIRSLESHLEFMLPDGAWDNSWGTRSFKWTYWGSRTSDGCQPAYALAVNHNPKFYKAALQNTLLLKNCTQNGLLYGGPHLVSHHELPCIHHTFCHAKAISTILDRQVHIDLTGANEVIMLPREESYGVKLMKDIQVWLISNENWKATIVGYDKEYSFKNGHPTGGAISILYHNKIGPVLASSMNKYQLIEAPNMQMDIDPFSIPLTPRLQTIDGKHMNISDLSASISYETIDNVIVFTTNSKLVDENQNNPKQGAINCMISYSFSDRQFELEIEHDCDNKKLVQFILPVISPSNEMFKFTSPRELVIEKVGGEVSIKANEDINILPTMEGKSRVFNFVPGMEAIPIELKSNKLKIQIAL